MGATDRKSDAGKVSTRVPITREVGPEDSTVIAQETDLSAAASDEDDSLLAAVAAAPGGAAGELEAGTVIGGTFRIDRRLGAGGMGVVYLAHDQSLGRAVAVKLHKVSAGVERLQREAMAMARLAHPNVIAVHEVGRIGDSVFVAMEYVEGATFRGWLKARPRPWREVLAMCLAAGNGLAAAHDAGLVHRDFKPENILVGDDGRPRVGDFGLARALGEATPESAETAETRSVDGEASASGSGSGKVLSDRLTMTGAMLGTPAYMAPEQLDGAEVDARADQFAFAVMTWESLYGARPFRGKEPRALRAAIGAGALTAPARATKVPARIRRVLARALAADRDARFPSLRALLVALAAAARPRRAVAALAVGAVALAGGGLALALAAGDGADPCAAATRDVDRALPATLVARLQQVLKGTAGDAGALGLIDARLTRTRASFADAARHVCKSARVTRELAPELEARASACLRYRARATALVLDDEALLRDAPSTYALRLRTLPVLSPCLDAVALAATTPPPAAATAEARALLLAARADLSIDRPAAARARLAEAEAVAGQDGAVAPLATLVRGMLAYDEDRHADAERLITDAYYAAQAVDDTEVYLEALATLLRFYGDDRFEPTRLEPWIRTAEAVVQKDRRRSRHGVVFVLRALAATADRRGDAAASLRWAEEAAALLTDSIDPLQRAEADYGLAHAYAAAGRYDEARARHEAVLPVFERIYGKAHPHYLMTVTDYAIVLADGGHLDEAFAVAQQAREGLAAWPAARSGDRATALLNLGVVLSDRPATLDAARDAFVEARDVYLGLYGAEHPDVALAEANLAVIENKRGEPRSALAALDRALAIQLRAFGPDHHEVAATHYNITAAALDLRDFERAAASAARAVAVFAVQIPGSERHVFALILESKALAGLGRVAEARTRAHQAAALAETLGDGSARVAASVEIARAMVLERRSLAEARSRLESARKTYAAYPDVFARRLVEIDELLAALAPPTQ